MNYQLLEKINQSALKFLEPLTPEKAYHMIISEALNLTGATYGSVILYQDNELRRVYSSTPEMNKIIIRKRATHFKAFKTGKVLVASETDVMVNNPVIKSLKIKQAIFIPLSYQKKTIGILVLDFVTLHTISKELLHALKLYGSMASMAIRKNALYQETKDALEVRDIFISLASHELRTPLTSITGYIQLLHSKLSKKGTIESKWIDELNLESQRLTYLVRELLELNRIRSGQLQFEWKECSLAEIIRKIVDRASIGNPLRDIRFINKCVGERSDIIIGDSGKVEQMLNALLDNAIKFSDPDTEIVFNLYCKVNLLIIDVIDKGKGIQKEEVEKIFGGFYKASDHFQNGLGVGLFLAKYIVTSHKGEISIHSGQNSGTRVTIKLPRYRD